MSAAIFFWLREKSIFDFSWLQEKILSRHAPLFELWKRGCGLRFDVS